MQELIDFMSIGTLMAYSLVAASVMILRYRPSPEDEAKFTAKEIILSQHHVTTLIWRTFKIPHSG